MVAVCLAGVVLAVTAPVAGAYALAPLIFTIAGDGTTCSTAPACGDGGPAISGQFNGPEGVTVDAAGNVYVADAALDVYVDPIIGDNEVRRVSPSGRITRIAGNGTTCANPPACGDGRAATRAQLSLPGGVAVDSAGNVYIADTGDNEVRRVSPSGRITRIAGNGTQCTHAPVCGDGGPAKRAQLNSPDGVAVDSVGNVYVADTGDSEVRTVSPSGTISRIAGNGTQPRSCSKVGSDPRAVSG